MPNRADPREPLDAEIRLLFDALRRGGAERPRVLEPEALRAGADAMIPLLNLGAPEGAAPEEIRIPGPAGELRALLFRPDPACRTASNCFRGSRPGGAPPTTSAPS